MRWICIALLLTFYPISAKAEDPEEKESSNTQTATTSDGRKVILKSDGTWEYAKEDLPAKKTAPVQQPSPVEQEEAVAAPPAPIIVPKEVEKGLLSFEATVQWKSGTVQPITGATFYLLDKDLEDILQSSGIEAEKRLSLLNTFLIAYYGSTLNVQRGVETFSKAMEAIKPHIIATTTTDGTGKGEFPPVPTGSYHLMNTSTVFPEAGGLTGRKSILWNVPVQIQSGPNSITLNEKNALY
jgi:hypothetical protein